MYSNFDNINTAKPWVRGNLFVIKGIINPYPQRDGRPYGLAYPGGLRVGAGWGANPLTRLWQKFKKKQKQKQKTEGENHKICHSKHVPSHVVFDYKHH